MGTAKIIAQFYLALRAVPYGPSLRDTGSRRPETYKIRPRPAADVKPHSFWLGRGALYLCCCNNMI